MKKILIPFSLFLFWAVNAQKPYVSNAWVADLNNGTYQNPVLYADYSDPDACRAGDDYYLTASSFNCVPGLPILHSRDLINWKIIGYALYGNTPDSLFSRPQHGGGVWAPSIRYHNDEFYIYWGDPDFGIYMVKTKNPAGEWDKPILVKAGKGLIDPCPLWDDDGTVWLSHAYAGSRAGMKSLVALTRLTADGKKTIGQTRIVFDGHLADPTVEGTKLYKHNGKYYIFAPAGGVATGWQLVLKADNIYGPYERRVVLAQGKSPINGPHQGAWVDTPNGEHWFLHFQDVGALGRIMHLQPMQWKNDFPVIGSDRDGDGCGEPLLRHKKPNLPRQTIETPAESDEFNTLEMGLQWQWHANPVAWWGFTNVQRGVLNLYSVPLPANYKNLWDVPNLLLQKFSAPELTATMKVTFAPDPRFTGERTGLLVMGMDYALLSFERTADGFALSQNMCLDAEHGKQELVNQSVILKDSTVYLRLKLSKNNQIVFSYSTDGEKFAVLGKSFKAREGKWIGAKMGTFCTRPRATNDGGRAEIDWFRIEK